MKDLPLHVDFLRIGKDGIIKVAIPVRFVNEALSPGLKRGGVLNIVRHEIEVYCPYQNIPQFFEASLEGLEIGRSLHISAIKMPEGVKTVIQGRDFTVATIAGAVKEEEVAATPGAAPGAEGAAAAASGCRRQGCRSGGRRQGCGSGSWRQRCSSCSWRQGSGCWRQGCGGGSAPRRSKRRRVSDPPGLTP